VHINSESYVSPSIAKHLVQDYLFHRKEKSHPLPDLPARQREVLQRIADRRGLDERHCQYVEAGREDR
jgi:DNA-binding NarL/FixJ family response regulator